MTADNRSFLSFWRGSGTARVVPFASKASGGIVDVMNSTSHGPVRLTLGVADPESERALTVLQRDLVSHAQLRVRRDAIVSEAVESGVKGAVGEVALLVTTSVSGLSVLAKVLNEWIRARARRSLKVTIGSDSIELSGPSSEALERALDSFLALHSPQLFGDDSHVEDGK